MPVPERCSPTPNSPHRASDHFVDHCLGADPGDSDSVYSATPHSVSTPLQIPDRRDSSADFVSRLGGVSGSKSDQRHRAAVVGSGCWVGLAAVTGMCEQHRDDSGQRRGSACVDHNRGSTKPALAFRRDHARTGLVSLVQVHRVSRVTPVVGKQRHGAFVKYTGLYVPKTAFPAHAW